MAIPGSKQMFTIENLKKQIDDRKWNDSKSLERWAELVRDRQTTIYHRN